VRSLTLKSQAPCLVYEEGSLIKRTIRDLYNKEIDEVFVAGDEAFREAKDFMKMIMPSHAKNVQLYKEDQPLFSKYGIEQQLDSMFSPTVTLPSGGYIVINPTEALVSIDVNSGRSTKEHNIEDTALQTNLEAAEEVARQLRLRDLAGLIVIDFIDMMENRSNRAVERKLKDCLKDDRARIQVGRISHFGLMEMSRQRIRFGVVESSTHKCPICEGTGLVRSVESLALMIMRHIEDHVLRRQGQSINVRVPVEVALYILNFKRETLIALEIRNQLSITITADGKMTGNQFAIEKGEARVMAYADQRVTEHVRVDSAVIDDEVEEDELVEETEEEDAEERPAAAAAEGAEGEGRRRRRRRRRGGADRGDDTGQRPPQQQRAAQAPSVEAEATDEDGEGDEDENSARPTGETQAEGEIRKRRRRGRRGGRRNRRDGEEGAERAPSPAGEGGLTVAETSAVASDLLAQDEIVAAEPAVAEAAPVEKPRRTRRKKVEETAEGTPVDAAPVDAAPAEIEAPAAEAEAAATEDKPKRKPRARKPKAETTEAAPVASVSEAAPAPAAAAAEAAPAESPKPRRAKKELPADGIVVSSSAPKAEAEGEQAEAPKKKAGWWQRRLGLG
ncbi:MAG: ribonuclease E/G, partial [Beijerinckiaceae bacterium]|nr:ribonuclease E/G [Beijerinckiaceae bacterium]